MNTTLEQRLYSQIYLGEIGDRKLTYKAEQKVRYGFGIFQVYEVTIFYLPEEPERYVVALPIDTTHLQGDEGFACQEIMGEVGNYEWLTVAESIERMEADGFLEIVKRYAVTATYETVVWAKDETEAEANANEKINEEPDGVWEIKQL